MSVLFTPMKMGDLEVPNRFVRSATGEGMATETGEVTGKLLEMYRRLASGGVGLIISGVMHVHPWGRTIKYGAGIHSDEMLPGLAGLADAVHSEGGKIIFQLSHGGRMTTREIIGRKPMSASAKHFDMVFMLRPAAMSEDEILEAVAAFGSAAKRAVEAGADGVQIHSAHGYLTNQFLSPFFNHRKDSWGGSEEGRFRFLSETVKEVKDSLPPGMPLCVKLNSNDYTPGPGIDTPMAVDYASRLASLGIDALEISCGTICYSIWKMSRGGVPVSEMAKYFSPFMKPLGWLYLKSMEGKFDLEEGYNLPAARAIKERVGGLPVMAVGGLRRVEHMEEVVQTGCADFVSMCRPFIREPSIVNSFAEGKSDAATCASCNRCLALIVGRMPLRCARGSA